MNTDKQHLQWIHDRLVQVYGVDEREDWMWKLREIIERQGWQPISTAPKDQWLLVWYQDAAYSAKFSTAWGFWDLPGPVELDSCCRLFPTHWMPLLNPPQIP